MAKKIYDITPPKMDSQIKEQIEGLAAEFVSNNNFEEIKERPLAKKRSRQSVRRKKDKYFLLKRILLGAGIFLAISLVYLFFKLPRAQVYIWPKTDDLSFKETIIVDKSVESVDLNNKVIPAEYLEEELELTEEFLATGNASNEGRAGGIITIYNKCDFFKQVILKVGTHFISDSNKYFKILSKATVPAAAKSGGKIIPGSVQVQIQAEEGGESYNIKPASFSVPKFAGTIYYYCIYAESKEPMSGGFASAVKKVTDEDVQNAKNVLTEKILLEVENSLKSKISSGSVLLDSTMSSKILSESSSIKPGTIIDKFNYTAKAKVKCLVFKKSDLEKFIKNYIMSKTLEPKSLVEDSLNINYNLETADIEGGKITFSTDFSAKIYPDIDKNSLISLLRRKTGEQINETINNNLGDKVSKVKINFWPFWVTKSPKNQKMINVELRFD